MKQLSVLASILVLTLIIVGKVNGSIIIDLVPIKNAGNIADINGHGAVNYEYSIGKYEVTNYQWNAFVTAAGAPTGDPNSAYDQDVYNNPYMFDDPQQPTNFVSWYEAIQFCNYLTSGDKSKGVYNFSGDNANPGVFIGIDRSAAIATYGQVFFLPNEDEWYKAAYFKQDRTGYSEFAFGVNTPPVPGIESNYADYFDAPWEVGTGAEEQNGTYDMMGNVWEWNETTIDILYRGYRGGSFGSSDSSRLSSFDEYDVAHLYEPDREYHYLGFRVAKNVPCYVIKRLTNTPYDENIPVISDNGNVAWSGGTSFQDEEIFLYNGFTTSRITNNSYLDHQPEINEYGAMVWYGFDGLDEEIFLFNGSTISQLTDNSSHDFTPKINPESHVAWRSHDQEDLSDMEIFYYDGSSVTQITDNLWPDYIRGLSDNDHIVWEQDSSDHNEIQLYNGSDIIVLSDQGSDPYMNSLGHVVWRTGFPTTDGYQAEIMLYDGINTIRITDNNWIDANQHMNANDQIVWQAKKDPNGLTDYEIFLYNGSDVIQITDNYYDNKNPQISDNGFVVWEGFDGDGWEIFLYDGHTTIQLTDDDIADTNPRINSRGDIAWRRLVGGNREIFLAARIFHPTITSPNGGEELIAGTSFQITWASPGMVVDNVKIEYSIDNGTNWIEIVAITENDGSYDWEVPYIFSDECLIRISDIDGLPFDESDSIITIGPSICRADFDYNKIVDYLDIQIFLETMGETDCTWWPVLCVCDTDNDDDVDATDLSVLVADFGRSDCP